MVRLPEDKEVSPKLKVSKLLTEFKQGFGGAGEINTPAIRDLKGINELGEQILIWINLHSAYTAILSN